MILEKRHFFMIKNQIESYFQIKYRIHTAQSLLPALLGLRDEIVDAAPVVGLVKLKFVPLLLHDMHHFCTALDVTDPPAMIPPRLRISLSHRPECRRADWLMKPCNGPRHAMGWGNHRRTQQTKLQTCVFEEHRLQPYPRYLSCVTSLTLVLQGDWAGGGKESH